MTQLIVRLTGDNPNDLVDALEKMAADIRLAKSRQGTSQMTYGTHGYTGSWTFDTQPTSTRQRLEAAADQATAMPERLHTIPTRQVLPGPVFSER